MAPRQPDGSVVRHRDDQPSGYAPTLVKRLTDAAVRRMADPFWGTSLGYAYLRGQITAQQCSAGRAWHEARSHYLMAICSPAPDPQPASIEGPRGGEPPDPDSFRGVMMHRRDLAAMRRYERLEMTLAGCGEWISTMTRRLAESREIVSMSYEEMEGAKIGLQSLHEALMGTSRKVS